MSSKILTYESVRFSIYQHLLMLYQGNGERENINALPESLRNQIFFSIWDQSGRAYDLDYGKVHTFDSPSRLQRAIQKVASKIFQELRKDQKDQLTCEISKHNRRPHTENQNWLENPAADNIPLLLEAMHNALGDLTPEVQQILNEWAAKAKSGEQRDEARKRIVEFLKNPSQLTLNLNDLGLKSTPAIFDNSILISKFQAMGLNFNKLASLPIEALLHKPKLFAKH